MWCAMSSRDGMRGPREVFLIRHAQSEANAGTCDECDCGLTALGKQQAEKTGEVLREHFHVSDVHAITSPYRRTRETAAGIGRGSGLVFHADPGCREWGKDCLIDGQSYPEETLAAAAERLEKFLNRLDAAGRYVIVSHATPIFLMLQILTRGSAAAALEQCVGEFWEPIKNCGVTHICEGRAVCVSKKLY
jgi:broad specificity phosphatase PhoE